MQDPPTTPTEDDEASIATEHMRKGPPLSAGSRKAIKCTLRWDLAEDEMQLALSQQQDGNVRETKRPRLEEPFSASTDKGPTENTLTHPDADDDNDHTDSDPVMDIHPNARTARVCCRWKQEEDAKLISAVTKTYKKKSGKKYRKDWVGIAALVPDRTKSSVKSDG
jgi:hypothetical protein